MIRVVIILCAIAGAWQAFNVPIQFWIDLGKTLIGVMLAASIMGAWLIGVAGWYRLKDDRRRKQLYKQA